MNRKVFAVIKREFITRARTKGFIIGTLLFPLLFVFFLGGIFVISVLFQPATKSFYIVDQTGKIYNEFVPMFRDTLKNGEPKYVFTEKKMESESLDAAVEEYQKLVLQKTIDGYFIIPENIIDTKTVTYSARSVSDSDEQQRYTRAFTRIITNLLLKEMKLSPEEIRKEMSLGRVSLSSRQITKEGEISKNMISSIVVAFVLPYIMFFLLMIYGQFVMRGVIEEKNQRITETIIASIKPVELMLGKLAGICLLGLTQLTVIGFVILLAFNYGEPLFVRFGVNTPDVLEFIRHLKVSPVVFIFMFTFFIMGFIFFSSLYAGIGAIVNTEDEGQQFQFPLIMLFIIGMLMMISVGQNPDTPMAFWTSLIPFFAPILMFSRVAVSDPVIPSGAYLSVIILGISTIIVIWMVAKIYRVGILMYGKKPTLRETIKWIKYK